MKATRDELWTFKKNLYSLISPTKSGGKVASDERIGLIRDARLERRNGHEELVAMVSVELRIHGSGVSLHCETQPGHFFRVANPGCRNSEMETNHVCRQA